MLEEKRLKEAEVERMCLEKEVAEKLWKEEEKAEEARKKDAEKKAEEDADKNSDNPEFGEDIDESPHK